MDSLNMVHISDFHLCADATRRVAGELPYPNFVQVIEHIADSDLAVDLLLIGGDVAHDGAVETYRKAHKLVSSLDAPFAVVAGNHDAADAMHSVLLANPLTCRDLLRGIGWDLHLVETQVEGEEDGEIPDSVVTSLGETCRQSEFSNHLLLMHHDIAQDPPGVRPGVVKPQRFWRELLSLDRRVVVLTGHRHMASGVTLGNVSVLGTPSTCVQFVSGKDDVERDPATKPGYRRVLLNSDGEFETQLCWP